MNQSKMIKSKEDNENDEGFQAMMNKLLLIKQEQEEKLHKIQQKAKPLLNEIQILNVKAGESLKAQKTQQVMKYMQKTIQIKNKNYTLFKLKELLSNVTANLQKIIQDLEAIDQMQILNKPEGKIEIKKAIPQVKQMNKLQLNKIKNQKLKPSKNQNLAKIKQSDPVNQIKVAEKVSKIILNNVKEQKDKNGNVVVSIQFSKDQEKIQKFKKNETSVYLNKIKITDDQVGALCQLLPQLQEINLYNCQQIKSIKLKGCKQLQLLSIQYNQSLTDLQLEQMPAFKGLHLFQSFQLKSIKLKNCPQITRISLSFSKVGDDDLQMLLKQCPNLQKLYLSDCKNIKQKIKLNNSKKIQKLYLDNINQSQDNLTQLLNQQGHQLVDLSLQGWKQVQFSQLKFINCIKLQKLWLNQTEIKDGDLQGLGKQLPQLKVLGLSVCKNILNPFFNDFNKLSIVYLYGTSVTKEKSQELKKKYPNLTIYY